jgi:Tol biopolymer transport system component
VPISYPSASGTQAATTANSTAVTLPTHQTGDLILLVLTSREDNPTPVHSITGGSGAYTQIGATQFLDLGTTGIAQSVWYRFATSGSETNPTANCPTPDVLAAHAHIFRGVDPTTPLDGVTVLQGTNAAATTFTPASITTGTDGAWVVSVVSTADDNALNHSAAQSFTLRASGANYDTTTGSDCAQGVATREIANGSTSVTMPTWNQSLVGADAWAYHTFVLRSGDDSETATDPVGITDTATTALSIVREVTDAIGVLDSAVGLAFSAYLETVTDPVGITDAATRTHAAVRTVTDPIGIVDTATAAKAAARTATDPVGITDTVETLLEAAPVGIGTITAQTVEVALRGDQWGFHLVRLHRWHDPILRQTLNPSTSTIFGEPAWSPDGRFVALATQQVSPSTLNLILYELVDGVLTLLANPSTVSGAGRSCAWSPDGRFLVHLSSSSPYVNIYERAATTFTKLSDPGTLPTGGGQAAAWSPDGRFLAVAHDTSPYITIYDRSGTTFTKLSNPGTLPAGTGRAVAWSADGRFLAHGLAASSPYITIYERSGTTFTKLTDPSFNINASTGGSLAFSPNGRFLVAQRGTTPFMQVYMLDGSTFEKVSDSGASTAASRPSWHPNSRLMAASTGIYSITPAGILTLVASAGAGIPVFSPDGRYMLMVNNGSDDIQLWETAGRLDPTNDPYLSLVAPGDR